MAANKDDRITDEVADQLVAGRDPASVFESGGLIDELKKRLAERMLNAEMDYHLGSVEGKKRPAIIATATTGRPSSATRPARTLDSPRSPQACRRSSSTAHCATAMASGAVNSINDGEADFFSPPCAAFMSRLSLP